MITVQKALTESEDGQIKCIQGVIILREGKVLLIDSGLFQVWKSSPAIELDVDDLQFALMLQLAQMDGSSIFFHSALVSGLVDGAKLKPTELKAKNTPTEEWTVLDFSDIMIAKGREQYAHLIDQPDEVVDFWSTSPSS